MLNHVAALGAERESCVRVDEVAWTKERVELLKRLHADGLSFSQIAGELGNVTRNAVIGKARRLGLELRGHRPRGPDTKPRKQSRVVSTITGTWITKATPRPAPAVAPAPEPFVVPLSLNPVTLWERNDPQQCQWLVGEGLYCGDPRIDQRARSRCLYCKGHARMSTRGAAA